MIRLYLEICSTYKVSPNPDHSNAILSFARSFFIANPAPNVVIDIFTVNIFTHVTALHKKLTQAIEALSREHLPTELRTHTGLYNFPEIFQLEHIAKQLVPLQSTAMGMDAATANTILPDNHKTAFNLLAGKNSFPVRNQAGNIAKQYVILLVRLIVNALNAIRSSIHIAISLQEIVDKKFFEHYFYESASENNLLEYDALACRIFAKLMNTRPALSNESFLHKAYLNYNKQIKDPWALRDLLWQTSSSGNVPTSEKILLLAITIYHIANLWENDFAPEKVCDVVTCARAAGLFTDDPKLLIANVILLKHLILEKIGFALGLLPTISDNEQFSSCVTRKSATSIGSIDISSLDVTLVTVVENMNFHDVFNNDTEGKDNLESEPPPRTHKHPLEELEYKEESDYRNIPRLYSVSSESAAVDADRDNYYMEEITCLPRKSISSPAVLQNKASIQPITKRLRA